MIRQKVNEVEIKGYMKRTEILGLPSIVWLGDFLIRSLTLSPAISLIIRSNSIVTFNIGGLDVAFIHTSPFSQASVYSQSFPVPKKTASPCVYS